MVRVAAEELHETMLMRTNLEKIIVEVRVPPAVTPLGVYRRPWASWGGGSVPFGESGSGEAPERVWDVLIASRGRVSVACQQLGERLSRPGPAWPGVRVGVSDLRCHVGAHAKAGAAEVVSSVRSIRRAIHWPNTISDTITTHDNQFLLLLVGAKYGDNCPGCVIM